jgi:hypothetical protein
MSDLVRDVVVSCDHGLRAAVRPVACLLGGSGRRQVKPTSVPRVTCALLTPSGAALARRLEAEVSAATCHAPCGTTVRQIPAEFFGACGDRDWQGFNAWTFAAS